MMLNSPGCKRDTSSLTKQDFPDPLSATITNSG
jgi:hypothetical protein